MIYKETESYILINDKMQNMFNYINEKSIDVIITDPPYEINFMGKSWDKSGIAFNKNTWIKCYSALKDGGYLIVFGGSRTFHKIASSIEDAGFEIRDIMMWLYGSGFPKSQNLGKQIDAKLKYGSPSASNLKKLEQEHGTNPRYIYQATNGLMSEKVLTLRKDYVCNNQWNGWGTCLKPAYEPIIIARKPFSGNLVDNVLKNNVGAMNIEDCKFMSDDSLEKRYPSNVVFSYDDSDVNDVCSNLIPYNAQRYFYCAKASKKDRDEGLEEFSYKLVNAYGGSNLDKKIVDNLSSRFRSLRKNIHPTVKPTSLMQYIVRMFAPKNSLVMDCFMGSGSTGKAVMYENIERDMNYKFIGIEMMEEYLPICNARIDYVLNKN